MAFVELNNKAGIVTTSVSQFPVGVATLSTIINAVGESMGFIGQIQFTSGSGTSKIISSTNGKIWIVVTAVTWAAVGTTLRVGIQDVNSATGIEDGTYDVFDDLVQGTDSLVNGNKEVIISSGTKTITHGDIIAVVVEMTVRNGSDTVSVTRPTGTWIDVNFPYVTIDTGTGPNKGSSNGAPFCAIQFDDGTIGHFGDWTLPCVVTEQSFGSTSSPDEYAMVFQLPFKCAINALFFRTGDIDAGDEATMHLIEDPFGIVTNLVTTSLSSAVNAQTGSATGHTTVEIPETTIEANTEYAVSYRATTTGTRIIRTLTFGNSVLRTALPILVSGATRTDLGAFIQSLTVIPDFGFRINKIDIGGGGGAVETSIAYVG